MGKPDKRLSPSAVDIGEIVAILARAERRISDLADREQSEKLVAGLHGVLSDLGLARLRLEGSSPNDARLLPRIHSRAMLCLRVGGDRPVEAELFDISAGGALVACDDALDAAERCAVEIDGLMEPITAVIKPAAQGRYHLVFQGLDADRTLTLAKHLDRSFFRF